jgi:hypothetical protein
VQTRACPLRQLQKAQGGVGRRREAGETLMDIARSYGVSHLTIMRLAA